MRLPAILIAAALADPAHAVCLENRSDLRLFGTVETDNGARLGAWLATGQRLCIGPQEAPGTVAVFDSDQAFEGCSRRIGESGHPAVLLDFVRFDRCTWAGAATD